MLPSHCISSLPCYSRLHKEQIGYHGFGQIYSIVFKSDLYDELDCYYGLIVNFGKI